jgi:HEAT repeat protein
LQVRNLRLNTAFRSPGKSVARAALAAFLLAAGACGRRPPYEGKDAAELAEMLRSEDPAVQVQGAYGLARLGPEAREALPALAAALKAPDVRVRQNAAAALAAIGPQAAGAVPALTETLGDPEWSVARQAAVALGAIGTAARPALPRLQKLTRSANRPLRQAAEEALKQIRR